MFEKKCTAKEGKFQIKLMKCKDKKETLFMVQKPLLMYISCIEHA